MPSDRRRFPRRACHYSIAIEFVNDEPPLLCETVDLSVGGVRVHSSVFRIPEGRCLLVLVVTEDRPPLLVGGDVVEEVIDADTGEVSARIVFRDPRPTVRDRLSELVVAEAG